MSVKLGDIDLNSDLLSIETNTNLNGTTLVESAMPNSAAADALMDQLNDQIRVGGDGGSLIDSGVEEIRGFDQGKEEESQKNNGGIELVEIGTRDGVGSKDFDGVAAEKIGTDFGLEDNGCTSFEAVGSDFANGEKGDTFAHSQERENNRFSLVVDLNMHNVADGETKSNDDETFIEEGTCIMVNNNGCINSARFNGNLRIEKEGEFEVSDLVWGKVPSHPWWPGQIYDRSAASKKALRYKKNDGFLIAYFGDQSFAWNDPSTLKPFRMYFSQMHKQSNMDSFTNAVSCALEEISRRVEYGLSCQCLPKQVYSKIELQVNVNDGIRKESRARVGGDNFSTVASFGTSKFVDYLKDLAQDPFQIIDGLEFVTTRAQLLAFNRWKGYAHLPKFTILNGLLDDDVPIFGKDGDPKELRDYGVICSRSDGQVLYGKGKSIILDNSSRKHKLLTGDCARPRKREKCMSDLISKDCPDPKDNMVENGGNGGNIPVSPGTASNTILSEKLFKVGDRIRKVANQLSGPTSILKHVERKSSNNSDEDKVGDCIRKVANQLSGPTSILKHVERKSSNNPDEDKKGAQFSNGVLCYRECPPAVEMLSELSFIAMDPMKSYNNLIATIKFFSDFRNLLCLDNCKPGKINVAEGSHDGDATEKLREGESVKEMTSVDTEATINARLNSTTAPPCENLESEAVGHTNEEVENNPTVLVLNFNDFKSIPSETKLNDIFSPFGPLIESYTEVLKKNNRAKVVFKRRVDAEKAFSSAGKFSTFGPSLISYRLNYKMSPRKPSTSVTKRKRKDVTPVKVKEL